MGGKRRNRRSVIEKPRRENDEDDEACDDEDGNQGADAKSLVSFGAKWPRPEYSKKGSRAPSNPHNDDDADDDDDAAIELPKPIMWWREWCWWCCKTVETLPPLPLPLPPGLRVVVVVGDDDAAAARNCLSRAEAVDALSSRGLALRAQ